MKSIYILFRRLSNLSELQIQSRDLVDELILWLIRVKREIELDVGELSNVIIVECNFRLNLVIFSVLLIVFGWKLCKPIHGKRCNFHISTIEQLFSKSNTSLSISYEILSSENQ